MPQASVDLPDGRAIALDDVGDPGGAPVLYLHGTPDSRLSRHPDDGLAAAAGVRLLAVDRPGYGDSSPLPRGTPATAFGDDAALLLDALGVDEVALLAWSGGALPALAAAAALGDRARTLLLASPVVPAEAYADPAVEAAAPDRAGLVALAEDLPPGDLGDEIAPLLAPYPCDRALAAEHRADSRDAATASAVAAIPGAADRLTDALLAAVRHGLAGVAADVEAANRPRTVDLGAVRCPVEVWCAEDDPITPPAFARWYATALPAATLRLTPPGSGTHALVLAAWPAVLSAATTKLRG